MKLALVLLSAVVAAALGEPDSDPGSLLTYGHPVGLAYSGAYVSPAYYSYAAPTSYYFGGRLLGKRSADPAYGYSGIRRGYLRGRGAAGYGRFAYGAGGRLGGWPFGK